MIQNTQFKILTSRESKINKLNWSKICVFISHFMYYKLSNIIKEFIDNNKINIDDFSDNVINELIYYLNKTKKIDEKQTNYIKYLINFNLHI